MAVLEKIRVKFGLAISIIIALALLSFIIDPTTLTSALQSMSSKYDVGKINGKSISYTDFQQDIERFTTINEIVTGSSVSSEQQQNQIRNSAWQALVDKYLFAKNAKAAGINVGEAEMVDLTTGDMVSPVLSSNYAFLDENGSFSADRLVEFVKSIDSDQSGRLKEYWNYLQNTIYTRQLYTKYGSLLGASDFQAPLNLQSSIAENNTTTDFDFVMVPFGFEIDSTIVVSDSEINSFYKEHKDFFKQNANRDIEYVVFQVIPSESDIAAVNAKMSDLHEEFATTDNVKAFLLKNSDRPLSDYWYKAGELTTINREVNDFVFSSDKNVGEVSGILSAGNVFYAARVMDAKMISDSVYVKHILLQGDNAANVADSLKSVLSGDTGKFSTLAAMYSVDQNSAADEELGNIGWLTQTYMIPGFESVIDAETGKPFILTTQYGTHVVLVSKKTAPVLKKQVAIYEKEVLASKETFNNYYAQANKFATIASGSYNNYRAAVDTMGVYSHPMNGVTESTSSYGAIDNAKEITRWVFDNKAGKVSNIITVNNNYFFVVAVKGVHEQGYAPVADVAENIRQQLYYKRLSETKAAEMAEKVKGLESLEAVAEALGTEISSQSDIAFSTMAGQGLDPKLIGAVSVAPENKLCGPVAGTIGTYMFRVTGRDVAAFFTEDDAKQAAAQRSQYKSQMVLPVMSDHDVVVDNRARFF